MRTTIDFQPDLDRDLVLERVVDIPPDAIWAAWTTPALITQWFTPAPWRTVDATIDPRPGGVFRTVMRSPDGQDFANEGCVLEAVENRRFSWTGGFKPGFRPHTKQELEGMPFSFTAVITMEPEGEGTRYRALAIHPDTDARDTHDRMGFHTGWSIALDQLVEVMKKQR